jgi:hypothetical protein
MGTNVNVTRDANGLVIQALAPDSSAIAKATIGAASVQLTIPSNAEVIRCSSNANCYILFGTNPTADANSILFPTGVELFRVPPDVTKIAVIQDGASTGTFVITRMM